MLNEDAKKIASAYDSIQEGDKSIGVGQNANLLAQEIGAEQFAMMMVDNPNYFNTIEPSLRQKLLEGSRKVLTLFGAVDGNTGNPLDVSISPILKRNKSIRNLYKNYTKQRDASIADKVDLADKGVAIKVRKGESADQAVDRMYGKVFGAKSFSLDDVSGFRINNKKIKKILTDIKDRLVESPEGSLRVERNQIVGKELNKDLKEALLFGDKLGNKNVLLNAMLEGIKNLTEFNFLYRAGKPSKYSDNELRARIVTPFQIRVTGLSPRSKSAASVKMDAYDLAYLRNNVEVLAREGFTNKPEDLIKEARRVAQQALEDPEGRINPEGNYENELVTAVFGQPESAQFIKNPKLRALLDPEQGPPKLKHSIRSYDVDALAGLVPTGKSGIAFDWFNIKNNYSPFDDKLFIPAYHGTPHTFSAEPGAPLGRFRTSAIGTGEGAQAYGHGLYFAGKREVAEHYRDMLTRQHGVKYPDGVYEKYAPLLDKAQDDVIKAQEAYDEAASNFVTDENTGELTIRTEFPPESVINKLESQIDKAQKQLDKLNEELLSKSLNKGSLYKVELAPKENEYLLWDKTLGEQTKDIQNKVRKVLTELEGEDLWEYRKDLDYRDITDNALENVPEPEISRRLKEAGIPGIKYLDGSSRSKGEGDYNYVIFDEADVQITDKLFMPAGDVMTAVNVRNELNNKFADLIVSGQKSIETRRSRSLDNLIGNRVKIVRTTGKGDEARVIGEVTIGEPIQYKTRAEFAKDYDKHLVDEDSDFAFQDGGKFGYPMINPERYDTPYPMPKRKGIVYTKEVGGPNKLFMPASEAGAGKGKQAETADLDFKISTRNPTAKNATENPITEDLIINTASIADDATMLESHALALQEYPGIKKNSKVPKRIIDRFVDHVVDNLLYLHDQVRPEVRNRSKLWYDGARNITEKWNQQYGNDKQSIAAALASLSPQKDWFMNVDLARRMLDIYKDQSGFAFDKAMAKKYIQLFEKGIGKKKATEIAEAMVGKTLNELQSDFEQAAFIRSYDEVYNPREYQVVSPEGDFIGLAKSLDGVNKKVAWGSMTEISKAVKVLRNPSKESISTALGNAHKIRNFYNNILLPNADEFSVTIDTHAIAAALLRPLAGADLEVANNFGSKPKGAKRSIKNSSVKGISGTYGIYADAYRKAAEARGILPREMQSITWEAVRGLYEAKWKTKSNKAKIDNLWKKYENGELTLNETREQILESAGGITEPEWVTERSNSGADGTNESANKSQELYRPELGGSELRANPRRGRTNSRGSQEVNFLPAGNFSRQPANRITRQAPAMPGNRFMLPAATAGAKSAERFR